MVAWSEVPPEADLSGQVERSGEGIWTWKGPGFLAWAAGGQASPSLHKHRGTVRATLVLLVSPEPRFAAALALAAQACSPEGFCGAAVG